MMTYGPSQEAACERFRDGGETSERFRSSNPNFSPHLSKWETQTYAFANWCFSTLFSDPTMQANC